MVQLGPYDKSRCNFMQDLDSLLAGWKLPMILLSLLRRFIQVFPEKISSEIVFNKADNVNTDGNFQAIWRTMPLKENMAQTLHALQNI
ncbi:hypothetical protein BGZ63DRAFT_388488 [Mariannaea sp. PMI_226]|nr:hypothetical protein BGZ63DRAFT_388488 [Mariannaea sp. PMI_226]